MGVLELHLSNNRLLNMQDGRDKTQRNVSKCVPSLGEKLPTPNALETGRINDLHQIQMELRRIYTILLCTILERSLIRDMTGVKNN